MVVKNLIIVLFALIIFSCQGNHPTSVESKSIPETSQQAAVGDYVSNPPLASVSISGISEGQIINGASVSFTYTASNLFSFVEMYTFYPYSGQCLLNSNQVDSFTDEYANYWDNQYPDYYSKTITVNNLTEGLQRIDAIADQGGFHGKQAHKTRTFYVRNPTQAPDVPLVSYSYGQNDGLVELTWNDVTNGNIWKIDGYRVYRSVDGGQWQKVAEFLGSDYSAANQYGATSEHPMVDNYGVVSFKVTSFVENFESGYSNTITYNYGDYYRDDER